MRSHDAIGIGLSGLCLVHCLAMPVLLSLGPALFWMENEWVHLVLAALALGASLMAMRSWVRGARGAVLRGVAAVALGLLFFGALGEMSEQAERIVTVVGACLLASTHGLAWISAQQSGRHRHRGG